MAVQQYYFKTSAGVNRLPIANATHTLDVSADYALTKVFVRFLDADGVEVSPTAGTVTFAYQPIGSLQWIAMTDPVITATTVKHNALSTYTPPTAAGPIKAVRAILASIEGATTVEILVNRFNA